MMGVSWFFFVWTCLGVIGVVVSLLTGIQKLLESGWRDFVRALAWLLTLGWLLAVPYYACFGGRPRIADSVCPLPSQVAEVEPIVAKLVGEPEPRVKANAERPAPVIQPAEPKVAKVESASIPAPALMQAETRGIPATKVVQVESTSVPAPTATKSPPLLAWSAPTAERQPLPLPLQKSLFSPSEVLFCPRCGEAYSSKGPSEDVTCPRCRNRVNLQSDPTKTVFRCVECQHLLKTPQVPRSPTAWLFRMPTKFNYFCPICGKKHVFEGQ